TPLEDRGRPVHAEAPGDRAWPRLQVRDLTSWARPSTHRGRLAVRLGVLDVGSNTIHLLIVDAHRGGHPTPMTSEKTALRLAESLDDSGRLTRSGADALVQVVHEARASAAAAGCEDLLAFATSALRDAVNSAAVLARVHAETGVALEVLPGDD